MEESQEVKPATQHKKQYDWLKQYQWQKGQSGNPAGGKKGKRLKTFVAEMLENMSDEDKAEFLKGLEPDLIWKMAEGNPTEEKNFRGHLTISDILDELENGQPSQGQMVENQPPLPNPQQGGTISSIQAQPDTNPLQPKSAQP